MDALAKIAILADAAKYDASCSTSGSARRNSPGGLGNGAVGGICHSWSSDGRCVALLKVLLSNICLWDCAYCVNRRSNDIPRASFEPDELAELVIDLYKRNYIEGALLSSAVFAAPDTVMSRLVDVATLLRERYRFNGYLHVKAIPGSSESILREAAVRADRVSVNIELPSASSLHALAPDKNPGTIFGTMRSIARLSGHEPRRIAGPSSVAIGMPDDELASSRGQPSRGRNPVPVRLPGPFAATGNPARTTASRSPDRSIDSFAGEIPPAPRPREGETATSPGARTTVMGARRSSTRNPEASVLPAGQTTQLVVGASPETDATILSLAENLYLAFDIRRVYYSAYIPVGRSDLVAAGSKPPLAREHRLYQADWLFRFYGFTASEVLPADAPYLDERLDPKCAWALRNLARFPVDLLSAEYLELLRVPGIGPMSARRILRARRAGGFGFDALRSLGVVMKRARFFIRIGARMPDSRDGVRWSRPPETPDTLARMLDDGLVPRDTQLEFEWGAT